MVSNRVCFRICLVVAMLAGISPLQAEVHRFADGFGSRVFNHVEQLVSIGPRPAGSWNERLAIEYVSTQLRSLGVTVRVEPFEFEGFEYRELEFQVGGEGYRPELIAFNPYGDEACQSGEILLFDPHPQEDRSEKPDLEGAAVATVWSEDPAERFQLLAMGPRLVVFLSELDFLALCESRDRRFELRVAGTTKEYRSANVIGTLAAIRPTTDEVLVCAHLDSHRDSPGADDNASGVGVLIELARYFAENPEARRANLRFLAFGAEEVGVLGARMYLARHRNSLRNCRLVFNIDQVGGAGPAYVEALGGVSGVEAGKGFDRLPTSIADKSWEGLQSQWVLNYPGLFSLLAASNRPTWYLELVKNSIDETPLNVELTGSLGGDSLVFSQAGIVASGITIQGNSVHGPDDVPGQIRIQSLEDCGRLVVELLCRIMAQKP